MTMRRTIAAVAVLGLGLVGCGDDEPEGTTEPTAAEETATTAPDDAPEGGQDAATVTVRDIAFQEASVRVQAGTEVTWVNEDSVPHTVTAGTPDNATGEFDEQLPADGEATVTVDEPGTYQYFCQVHPSMTAELVVEG